MSTETSSNPDVVILHWEKGFRFTANGSSGSMAFDVSPEHGGDGSAISPFDALLASAAGCSAIDVVTVLNKKRQKLESYRVEVTWDRKMDGDYPHPITAIRITHILKGPELDEAAVRHAVELSDAKYCTVVATIRQGPEVTSDFRIEPGP